jgi:hypothetical protein
LGEM